jgi:hypothetical protein
MVDLLVVVGDNLPSLARVAERDQVIFAGKLLIPVAVANAINFPQVYIRNSWRFRA